MQSFLIKLSIALVTSFLANPASAQILELTQTTYVSHNISTGQTRTNPFKKYTFREKGDLSYKSIGAYGKKLKPYFIDNEEALAELSKYKTKRKIAIYSAIGAIGSFVVFATTNLSSNDEVGTGPKNTELMGLTVALAFTDFIFALSSNQHILNAVSLHNNRILQDKKLKKMSMSLKITPMYNHNNPMTYGLSTGIKIKF